MGQGEYCPWEIFVLSGFTCLELEMCLGGREPSRLSFEAKSLTENNEEHHSALTQYKVLPLQLLSGYSLLQKSWGSSPHRHRVRTAGVEVIRHVREKTVVWAVGPL